MITTPAATVAASGGGVDFFAGHCALSHDKDLKTL